LRARLREGRALDLVVQGAAVSPQGT
jgi:hypothetical protein